MPVEKINVDELFDLLSKGQEAIDSTKDKDLICFFGVTSAGKSTLLNYLLGYEMEAAYDEETYRPIVRIKHGQAPISVLESQSEAVIGKATYNSQTLYPQAYTLSNGMTLCDFPGAYSDAS